MVPRAARARAAAVRRALRRRAADACDRARACLRAELAHARRAVDGSRTVNRRRDLRAHRRNPQELGPRRAARRAARRRGVRICEPRLRARERARHPRRRPRGTRARRPHPARLSRHVEPAARITLYSALASRARGGKPAVQQRTTNRRTVTKALAASLAACAAPRVLAQGSGPVKIGLIAPLSGPWARQG